MRFLGRASDSVLGGVTWLAELELESAWNATESSGCYATVTVIWSWLLSEGSGAPRGRPSHHGTQIVSPGIT